MAPGILTLHHLGRFEESALLAARNGADRIGFFTTPDGAPPAINDGTGAADETPITVTVPGQYDTLPDGVQFTAYESKYPDAIMGDFVKLYQRRAASAFNVAYNGLANDLEGVNYSSIRAGVLEERDTWIELQNWLVEQLVEPVFREWLSLGLLAGAITFPAGAALPALKFDKFYPHSFTGRRWQWVDPEKDAQANILAVKHGWTTNEKVAAERGEGRRRVGLGHGQHAVELRACEEGLLRRGDEHALDALLVGLDALDHRGQIGLPLHGHGVDRRAGCIVGDGRDAVGAEFVADGAQDQIFSMIVAMPMPPPTHSVMRPRLSLRRSSSSSSVPSSIAPVAPSGWPSAIAPPLTFVRSCG